MRAILIVIGIIVAITVIGAIVSVWEEILSPLIIFGWLAGIAASIYFFEVKIGIKRAVVILGGFCKYSLGGFRHIFQQLKRFGQWLSSTDVSTNGGHSSSKTYSQRYAETDEMSNEEIQAMIVHRESKGYPCGAAYHVLANRPGKTYAQRYFLTSAMSTSEIRALIEERERQGKECGVLYRVLSERR